MKDYVIKFIVAALLLITALAFLFIWQNVKICLLLGACAVVEACMAVYSRLKDK